MESWTGFTGKEDGEIRKNGKEFIIAIDENDKMMVLANIDDLEDIEWSEWCNVYALSEEKAKENYDRAFLQWKEYNNNGGIREDKNRQ